MGALALKVITKTMNKMEIILTVVGLAVVVITALVLATWEDRRTRKYLTQRKAEEQVQLRQERKRKEAEQVILAPNPQAALLVAQLQDRLHKKEAQEAQEAKLVRELQALNQQVQEATQEVKVVLQGTEKMAPAVEMVPVEALVKPKRKKRQPRKKKVEKPI